MGSRRSRIVKGFSDDDDILTTTSSGMISDKLGRMGKIIVTDVEATNGVIHATDIVVLPYSP